MNTFLKAIGALVALVGAAVVVKILIDRFAQCGDTEFEMEDEMINTDDFSPEIEIITSEEE